MPTGGVHTGTITFKFDSTSAVWSSERSKLHRGGFRTFRGAELERFGITSGRFRLRLHTVVRTHDFAFVIDPADVQLSRSDPHDLLTPKP